MLRHALVCVAIVFVLVMMRVAKAITTGPESEGNERYTTKGRLAQMIEAYQETGGNLVAVEDVPREETNRYGILDVSDDDGRIAAAKGLVEKPAPEEAPSTLSIIGRYILQPEVFDELERQEAGAGGEIQLTDAMAHTIGRVPFHGLRFEGRRFDCGNKAGFLEANVAFGLARGDLAEDMAEILGRYCGGDDAGSGRVGRVVLRGATARSDGTTRDRPAGVNDRPVMTHHEADLPLLEP